jgi:hypothetical protein
MNQIQFSMVEGSARSTDHAREYHICKGLWLLAYPKPLYEFCGQISDLNTMTISRILNTQIY